ncbi:MAG: hypothetical protein IID39_10425 [Planctomycetes bacterium]|nr:hypothetical protein [Planctomycetota bacterium]
MIRSDHQSTAQEQWHTSDAAAESQCHNAVAQRFAVTVKFGSFSIISTKARKARLAEVESGKTLATSGDSTTTLLPLS